MRFWSSDLGISSRWIKCPLPRILQCNLRMIYRLRPTFDSDTKTIQNTEIFLLRCGAYQLIVVFYIFLYIISRHLIFDVSAAARDSTYCTCWLNTGNHSRSHQPEILNPPSPSPTTITAGNIGLNNRANLMAVAIKLDISVVLR